MNQTAKITDWVIRPDLCSGCGLCVYKCPAHALKMQWNENGFLTPGVKGTCDLNGDCLRICPFNPFPEKEVFTETELAGLFLQEAPEFHPQIGRYTGLYAGYANEFQLSSTSGGITTYFLTELFKKGIVGHVFTVKSSAAPGVSYEYGICSSVEEIIETARTRYFPVTLGNVMSRLHDLKGKVAIVGVGCFIKAVRLAQYYDAQLVEKIPLLVGIICGGIKSRFFTDYLAEKAGVAKDNYTHPEYRIKDYGRKAEDYSFGCTDKLTHEDMKTGMREVGDMWGTGLFKANACDYCDDLFTELADISLGDAWISPFCEDGRGTNIVITRSFPAEKIITEGMKNNKLHLEELSASQIMLSQRGNANHKHAGLPVRIDTARRNKTTVPRKRYESDQVSLIFRIVQVIRMRVRRLSLDTWSHFPNAKEFDRKMKRWLQTLKFFTLIYHYHKTISLKLGRKQAKRQSVSHLNSGN